MSYPPQDPYGYGYGIPGHPHQYGGFGPPPPPASNGAAIAALIANIVLSLTCCGLLAIPGIVTAAIAVSRTQTDPVSAKNLTNWSWVIFGLAILVGVVFLIIFFAFGLYGAFEGSSSSDNGGVSV